MGNVIPALSSYRRGLLIQHPMARPGAYTCWNHIVASFVQVVDNNDIDREIVKFQPTVVIIEAFWVVPDKFDILKILHPKVVLVVRNHSEIPFLANEGVAFEWLQGIFS